MKVISYKYILHDNNLFKDKSLRRAMIIFTKQIFISGGELGTSNS